jgi:hypothetical protein
VLLQDKTTREIEQACAAALYNPVKWIELANRFPQPGEHVMVKMADGNIEIAYWDSARAGWSHNPFESGGQPVAWAALPRINTSNGFGR